MAGHADPDLGVMVVSVPDGPTQRIEMERQIPHELMHVLLYQLIGNKYQLPTWFNEGLATISELYPDPDYYTYLMRAKANDSLIPLTNLCASFPLGVEPTWLTPRQALSCVSFTTEWVRKDCGHWCRCMWVG